MERVELALYLLSLAQRHRLFLLAGELVGFKFERVYSRPHALAYLPHCVCLAADGYNPRQALFDKLLCREHTPQVLIGKRLRFFFYFFCHIEILKGAAASRYRPRYRIVSGLRTCAFSRIFHLALNEHCSVEVVCVDCLCCNAYMEQEHAVIEGEVRHNFSFREQER